MNFLCEDLAKHGVLLVPQTSKDYDPLLSDIINRLAAPVDGSPPFPEILRPRISQEDRPTSAILLNQSTKGIAALHVVWRFETETGHSYRHSIGMLSPQGLLLRFGILDEAQLKLYGYWHTILPGSKRYLGESGLVGDNTDVRPPAQEEKWRGGIMGGGSRGFHGENPRDPIKQVTLVLDGLFFLGRRVRWPERRNTVRADRRRRRSSLARRPNCARRPQQKHASRADFCRNRKNDRSRSGISSAEHCFP